jgi:hypothetical protein
MNPQAGPRGGLSLLRETITRSGKHLDIIKIISIIYLLAYKVSYRRFPRQVFIIFSTKQILERLKE